MSVKAWMTVRFMDTLKVFPKRDIFAVVYGLQQLFSKVSLVYLENNCRKALTTFGRKIP